MFEWLTSWCGPLTILLLFLVIQFWLQLLKWKKWAQDYKEWVDRNCECQSPGGDPPPLEPGWP